MSNLEFGLIRTSSSGLGEWRGASMFGRITAFDRVGITGPLLYGGGGGNNSDVCWRRIRSLSLLLSKWSLFLHSSLCTMFLVGKKAVFGTCEYEVRCGTAGVLIARRLLLDGVGVSLLRLRTVAVDGWGGANLASDRTRVGLGSSGSTRGTLRDRWRVRPRERSSSSCNAWSSAHGSSSSSITMVSTYLGTDVSGTGGRPSGGLGGSGGMVTRGGS